MDGDQLASHYNSMNRTLGNVIRTARKQRKKTQKEVAATLAVTYQAVGQWERGDNEISMTNLRKLAGFLGIDPVSALSGELRFVDIEQALNEVQQVTDPAPMPDRGPKDVPVQGVSYGGGDSDFTTYSDVVDYVRRPVGIAHVKDVFALHVLGTSMEPRFEPGDLIYCGGREPIPGDDIVIKLKPEAEHENGKGFIKRLIGRQSGLLICRQFNPAKEVEFKLADIDRVYRVIPAKELLGF
ncbi:helix-turn-helix transcriptional regulator [Aureimonas fodinaquatilis]|uniref:Helix-turn-helix transcriptional regulator n=1 Tax=Aureimonas fodinaquatilis TaxID=2565783 RepID=A0A5B0DYL7_9HYPH|nr:XRE family transcriptional regulator [Aureimonas fodinaquatilis]KAA0970289.1 helix-turn-helix transcriptional regulator [Aureimonas fodinaquatilis]